MICTHLRSGSESRGCGSTVCVECVSTFRSYMTPTSSGCKLTGRHSVWGERPDRNKQGLGRAQRNKERIVPTFPDCLGGPLRPGLTSLAARCTWTQFSWMRTGVPVLGLRHLRNPGETKMRRHKLSSELSSSGQGPGLSPSRHDLPRTRIFERSQEGRKTMLEKQGLIQGNGHTNRSISAELEQELTSCLCWIAISGPEGRSVAGVVGR